MQLKATGSLAKQWLPPALRAALNNAIGASITYHGPFPSWDAACRSTTGYDEDAILQRIVASTQKVLSGEARYEQDGVVFPTPPPASHALTGLLLAASHNHGNLSVLDFGGALGSHYLRWRPMLDSLPNVQWAIVEQPAFVAEGKRLFMDNPALTFHERISTVPMQPNAILASSVLQYLPDPYMVLRELIALRAETIVLDRLPYGIQDAAIAQFVPTKLGKASYPLWVLSRSKIHGLLNDAYALAIEFAAPDQQIRTSGIKATYHGSIWVRRA
ncbi:MAG: methyltransferase, TIGR04325 family [Proteobacteria bacterium]|nr:methyltransferase, TIGR04325 family [Pseudomonadota bacterium]